MKVGDLVCWHDKRALLGVVTKVARSGVHIACAVQWANGIESNHHIHQLIKVETSEDT